MTFNFYGSTLYTELAEVILSRLVEGVALSDVRTEELVRKFNEFEDPSDLEGCWDSPFTARLVEDFELYFILGASLGYEYWCLEGDDLFDALAQRTAAVSYDFGEQIKFLAREAGCRFAICVSLMERDLFLSVAEGRLSRR